MHENSDGKLGENKKEVLLREREEIVGDTRREFMKKALKHTVFAVGAMALVSMSKESAFAADHDDISHLDSNHDDVHGDSHTDHNDGVHNDVLHYDLHFDHSEYTDMPHWDHNDHSDHSDHSDYK